MRNDDENDGSSEGSADGSSATDEGAGESSGEQCPGSPPSGKKVFAIVASPAAAAAASSAASVVSTGSRSSDTRRRLKGKVRARSPAAQSEPPSSKRAKSSGTAALTCSSQDRAALRSLLETSEGIATNVAAGAYDNVIGRSLQRLLHD